MGLTGKEKRMLRGRGQTLADDGHVGKAGVTEGVLANFRGLLARKELIKVRFDELEGGDRRDFGAELAAALDAECITVVGRTVVLYRANPELPAAQRVLGEAAS